MRQSWQSLPKLARCQTVVLEIAFCSSFATFSGGAEQLPHIHGLRWCTPLTMPSRLLKPSGTSNDLTSAPLRRCRTAVMRNFV